MSFPPKENFLDETLAGLANYDCLADYGHDWVGRLTELPPIQSVLEIIEPEAEVVDSIRSGNVPVQLIH